MTSPFLLGIVSQRVDPSPSSLGPSAPNFLLPSSGPEPVDPCPGSQLIHTSDPGAFLLPKPSTARAPHQIHIPPRNSSGCSQPWEETTTGLPDEGGMGVELEEPLAQPGLPSLWTQQGVTHELITHMHET